MRLEYPYRKGTAGLDVILDEVGMKILFKSCRRAWGAGEDAADDSTMCAVP